MRFFLIITSVLLTLYTIPNAELTLTYSDATLLLLVPIFLSDIFRRFIIVNTYSKLLLSYVFLLLFSSLVNSSITQGAFLNIFKTSLISWMFFTWTYSLIIRNKISRKLYFFSIAFLAIVFLSITWSQITDAWAESEVGFTQINLFKSSLDINVWGFIVLTFFILTAYSWSVNFYKKVASILLFFFGALVLFSFSRTAWSLLTLSFIWIFYYVSKFKFEKLLSLVIPLIVALVINNYFTIINFDIPTAASDFFKGKTSNYESDLVDVRFYLINLKPIVENFSEFNFFQFFIGDAKSVQHSWLSNSLVVTGLVGFLLYMLKFLFAIKYSIKCIKLSLIESKYLLLFVIVIIINDFMTNSCLFVPFAGYISHVILAVLFAETEIRRIKKHFIKIDYK